MFMHSCFESIKVFKELFKDSLQGAELEFLEWERGCNMKAIRVDLKIK
jgi:hypothetical protein